MNKQNKTIISAIYLIYINIIELKTLIIFPHPQ